MQADPSGRYGRGIPVQDAVVAALDTVDVDREVDAGIFVLQPIAASLIGVSVGTVDPGLAEYGLTPTGDDGTGSYDPAGFVATVDASTVSGACRVGLLVDHASVEADGHTVSGADVTAE